MVVGGLSLGFPKGIFFIAYLSICLPVFFIHNYLYDYLPAFLLYILTMGSPGLTDGQDHYTGVCRLLQALVVGSVRREWLAVSFFEKTGVLFARVF